MTITNDRKIHLGIAMAGAVSAGAYTAGVMDYLIEALEKWQVKKDENEALRKEGKKENPMIPEFDVVIEVISGASAGGITAALSPVALHGEIPHISSSGNLKEEDKKKNVFYNTWVKMGDCDLLDRLLDTGDLTKGQEPLSILNASILEDIAKNAVFTRSELDKVERKYVSDNLDIFMTICNLSGTQQKIQFLNGKGHEMCLHHDIVHFVERGDCETTDYRIPLCLGNKEKVELLRTAALATGAFPLVFPPREVKKPKMNLQENPILHNQGANPNNSQPSGNRRRTESQLCIDGGLINNEPFGITKRILEKKGGKSVIVMIDPFPNQSQNCGQGEEGKPLNLIGIAMSIINAIGNQLRFKFDDVTDASSYKVTDLFMLAPKSDKRPSAPLATGALSGFAGFLDKSFRKQDFMLGRKNCQSFLRKYFVQEFDQEGYRNAGWTDEAVKEFRSLEFDGANDSSKVYLPIVPDMGMLYQRGKSSEIVEDNFPKYDPEKLRDYQKKIKKRIKTLGGVLVNSIKDNKNTPAKSQTRVPWLRKIICFLAKIRVYFCVFLVYILFLSSLPLVVKFILRKIAEELRAAPGEST